MLKRSMLVLAGCVLFSAVGCVSAGPRVVVTPRPLHPFSPGVTVVPGAPRALWWQTYPYSPPAYVVETPAYGGVWSVTITDTMGHSATYREGGSTVYEAQSYAKGAFIRQFPEHGELSVTSATQLAP